MSADEEFTAYMTVRWPSLVRSLVLLGYERYEAEDVAQAGLARCYASWARVSRADDVDAYVFRTVLGVRARSRRRRWWPERPSDSVPEPVGEDPADGPVARRIAREVVRTALGRLSAEHRAVLVLRFVADLSESQVAEVLGVAVGTVRRRTSRALTHVDADASSEEMP